MKNILIVGAALSLSGCSSLIGDPVDQMVPFEGGGTRTFTFKKAYPEQKISTSEIARAMVNAMKNASALKAYHKRRTDLGTYRQGVSIHSSKSLKRLDGLTFQPTGEKSFVVTHADEFESVKDNKSAVYPYEITENEKEYTLTMRCPNEFHDIATLRGGEFSYEQYTTEKEAIKNFNDICLNTNKPTIETYQKVKGEYNSKYSPTDITANFERLLKKVKDKSRKTLENTYYLSASNTKYSILAETVPYRGGSKTTYEFKYPFKLNSSMNSYNQKEIELVKNKIKSIIND